MLIQLRLIFQQLFSSTTSFLAYLHTFVANKYIVTKKKKPWPGFTAQPRKNEHANIQKLNN